MSQIHIHIDRIALKLHGVDATVAQSLAQSLGPALLQAISQQPELLTRLQGGSPHQYNNLDLGKIQVSLHQDLKIINQAVVQKIIPVITSTPTLPSPPSSHS